MARSPLLQLLQPTSLRKMVEDSFGSTIITNQCWRKNQRILKVNGGLKNLSEDNSLEGFVTKTEGGTHDTGESDQRKNSAKQYA